MDKRWMQLTNRWCTAYKNGIEEFLVFAYDHANGRDKIRCPCKVCNNMYLKDFSIVEDHLYENGIAQSYTRWVLHGESIEPNGIENDNRSVGMGDVNFVQEILEDVYGGVATDTFQEATSYEKLLRKEPAKFSKLLHEAESELYPGNQKYTTLSFLIKLLHYKTMRKWSNKSIDNLLDLFKDVLPEGEKLPKSHKEVQSLIRDLGLGYTLIHACKYDCVLFWKEYVDLEECPVCSTSRWKSISRKGKKIPHKVLRYFPLKPRLQRLFVSRKTATDMRWHMEKRVEENGVLRHPADSEAWKEFDKEHEWFSQDPRNIRLGLASDGFNPFGSMSTKYSMWPVILMPYNLPPWKCMKEPFLLMSLLIPGPESPGSNIDVYLQPLVDELKELWQDGIETYDAHSKESFQLHASLLWTINDFPAYGLLSGWSTKGKLACPVRNEETCSMTLKNGRKQCYMGHRRFLNLRHRWRKSRKFNGKHEKRSKPKTLSGDDVLSQLARIPTVPYGKHPNGRKRKRSESELNWTKKSIFFQLPYWRTLKLRHNLDVMHIEKNIFENLLGTLMNIDGKTKDNINARLDLALLGIREELHVQYVGDKIVKPPASYTLSPNERRNFCEWLKSIKFPDGYASNISRCVNVKDCKISGLKSHDCHVLLRLLPIAIRGYLDKNVSGALTELSLFFKELCSKTLHLNVLDKLESDIVVILCKLELIFPPAFFDVMVHLAIHLAYEAKVGGPVRYRWMYPIERFLRTLKESVRNKAHPEGSIAEAYIDKECLTFCSMYLDDVETRFNKEERNYDGGQSQLCSKLSVFGCNVRPLGGAIYDKLNLNEYKKCQWYVLNNCIGLDAYTEEHKEEIRRTLGANVQQRHQEEFASWFKSRMLQLRDENSPEATDDLYSLALGPDYRVVRYSGCIVNGVRFHTTNRDMQRITQNSGLVVKGEHQSHEIDFYGVLLDIIQLKYSLGNHVYLFKCKWWNVGDKKEGIRRDEHFTSVNVAKTWYANDPFVLASQAEQVYYVNDPKNGSAWQVVQKVNPRNIFDVGELNQNGEDIHNESFDQAETTNDFVRVDDRDVDTFIRQDLVPDHIDASLISSGKESDQENIHDMDDDIDEEDDTMVDYDTDGSQEDDDDDDDDIETMM